MITFPAYARDPADALPANTASAILLRVVLPYAVFACLWILGSDWLLAALVSESELLSQLSTVKGWAFVGATCMLLYVWMRREISRHLLPLPSRNAANEKPHSPSARRLAAPLVVIALAVVVLAASAIVFSYYRQEARQSERLAAIVELQANRIAEWVHHRIGELHFIRTDHRFADLYRRWHERGDVASRDLLLGQLTEYAVANEYRGVLVLDESGMVVGREGGLKRETPPELRDAAVRAVNTGESQQTGVYYLEKSSLPIRIDFVVPLAPPGERAHAAVALRIDPRDGVYPALGVWPSENISGEAVLWRRDGDSALAMSEFRQRPGSAGRLRLSLLDQDLAVSRVLLGNVSPGMAFEGRDYTGALALAVARPVQGTDWWLIAKIDHDEIYAPALREAVWIVLACVLALFAAGVGAYGYHEREALHYALAEHADREDKLRALQLLESIADASTDAIYAKDLDGRYLLFSREASRMTGKTKEQVIGRDARSIFPAGEADLIKEGDARIIAEGRVQTYEEAVTTVTGESIHLSTKGPLCDADGQVVGTFGVSRDITLRKRHETQLREQARLLEQRVAERTLDLSKEVQSRARAENEVRELNTALRAHATALERTVGDLEAFSYTISHDLRAPLRAINGFTTLLSRSESERMSPEGRTMLARVLASSSRMGRMIEDILAYSRAEREQLRLGPVDLGLLVAGVVEELAPAYPGATVAVESLPVVQGDPAMLRQILANLVGNALKFSSQRKDARVDIGVRERDGRPEISVRDNGAGFDMQYADRLFGLFKRLHSDSEFPGSGVGLAIVKRLVEKHGGEIRVESAPGKGSVLSFTLGGTPRA